MGNRHWEGAGRRRARPLRATSIETITKQNMASKTIFARPIPAPAIEAAAYTIPKAIPTICTRRGLREVMRGWARAFTDNHQ